MTDKELDEMQAVCDAATPPPWEARIGGLFNLWQVYRPGVFRSENSEADSIFTARAREWVPALVAEVRRLQQDARVAAIETEERCIEEAQAARENERERCLAAVRAVADAQDKPKLREVCEAIRRLIEETAP